MINEAAAWDKKQNQKPKHKQQRKEQLQEVSWGALEMPVAGQGFCPAHFNSVWSSPGQTI